MLVTIIILLLLLAAGVYAVNLFRARLPSVPRNRRASPSPRRRRGPSGVDGSMASAYVATDDHDRRRRDCDSVGASSYADSGPSWGDAHRSGGSWDDAPSSSGGSDSSSSSDSSGSSVD